MVAVPQVNELMMNKSDHHVFLFCEIYKSLTAKAHHLFKTLSRPKFIQKCYRKSYRKTLDLIKMEKLAQVSEKI
jgi:hypothetical protein